MEPLPLFHRFPLLEETIPRCSLGEYPTPVEPLDGLNRELNTSNLFVKRDDLSGPMYGGNKVRKLEFLLGDARSKGAKRVITFGAAGSNHALATAICAREAGLAATLILSDQPPSPVVAENLQADLWAGADVVYEKQFSRFDQVCAALLERYREEEGARPYVIPVGGSSVPGAIGFVNAAFELRQQIDKGEVPEPGAIFVPLGTMGTAVGLLVGCFVAGIRTHIVGVRVVPSSMASRSGIETYFAETVRRLRRADPAFPRCILDEGAMRISREYYEPGYGKASPEVVSAVETAEKAGLHLDTTYSGKAFAAFLRAAREQRNMPMLFWNTKSSRPLPEQIRRVDFHRLPEPLHRYFESPPSKASKKKGIARLFSWAG